LPSISNSNTVNPYSDAAEVDAWDTGYHCYRPLTRDGGDAFSALWASLNTVLRPAAYDGWICAIIDAERALTERNPDLPTTEHLADEFANRATRNILAQDGGFSVTEALSKKPSSVKKP
jgi:hypothetical protein